MTVRVAAIDCGTNSIRLLVADVADELGVNRSTVYKAMARRGYRPTRAKAATATE